MRMGGEVVGRSIGMSCRLCNLVISGVRFGGALRGVGMNGEVFVYNYQDLGACCTHPIIHTIQTDGSIHIVPLGSSSTEENKTKSVGF